MLVSDILAMKTLACVRGFSRGASKQVSRLKNLKPQKGFRVSQNSLD